MARKKGILSLLLIVILLLSSNAAVFAADQPKEKTKKDVERVDFIHYKVKNSAAKVVKTDPGYKLMGVKWLTTPVNYVINLNNTDLSADFVTNAVSTSAETWDSATGRELFNDTFTVDSDNSAVFRELDGENAICFGPYSDPNVIAVTSVWYNRKTKGIVEFDMLFNTDGFTWGYVDPSVGSETIMDLQNIATHELGHAVGLADVYISAYSYVTMYGYSWEGDTDKRSLAAPDIIGIQKLYGGL